MTIADIIYISTVHLVYYQCDLEIDLTNVTSTENAMFGLHRHLIARFGVL